MKCRLSVLTLLIFVTLNPLRAETAALPEPGPEDGGLRLRLVVAPRTEAGKEGYDVRVDLLNTSERAITLRAGWESEDTGDLKDYIDAATSIECVPAVRRWMGQVRQGQRKSPQPEQVIKPGALLSVHWQTEGRHLKNRVTNPIEVQNPEFPFLGLYSVHATVNVLTSEGTVALRSNEQLVPVGGSRAMPKSSLGQLMQVEPNGKTAMLNLGSLQKVEPGDQFQYSSMREQGKLTVTTVKPGYSMGNLEVLFPTNAAPPLRGTEVTLIPVTDRGQALALPVHQAAAEPTPTNLFGIFLFAESKDWRETAGNWTRSALSPKPVISEADIAAYNFTNHTMTLRTQAVQRISKLRAHQLIEPFVVVANGERIYRGAFVSPFCSHSVALPSITLWGEMQFTSYTNLPPNSLVIERTYGAPFSKTDPDPRSDDRIKRALERSRSIRFGSWTNLVW